MSEHKFVYTISGIDLSDHQKAAISREIGSAVARSLAGHSSKVKTDCLTVTKIHGGRWIDAAEVADQSVREVLQGSEG